MAVEAEVQNCKKRKIVEKSNLPFIHGNSSPFIPITDRSKQKAPPLPTEFQSSGTCLSTPHILQKERNDLSCFRSAEGYMSPVWWFSRAGTNSRRLD